VQNKGALPDQKSRPSLSLAANVTSYRLNVMPRSRWSVIPRMRLHFCSFIDFIWNWPLNVECHCWSRHCSVPGCPILQAGCLSCLSTNNGKALKNGKCNLLKIKMPLYCLKSGSSMSISHTTYILGPSLSSPALSFKACIISYIADEDEQVGL